MKCPKCEADIEYLCAEFVSETRKFRIDTRGKKEFIDRFEGAESEPRRGWHCCKCWTRLADEEEEAVKLLRPPLVRKIDEVLSDENDS